jgi:hypothetical protein
MAGRCLPPRPALGRSCPSPIRERRTLCAAVCIHVKRAPLCEGATSPGRGHHCITTTNRIVPHRMFHETGAVRSSIRMPIETGTSPMPANEYVRSKRLRTWLSRAISSVPVMRKAPAYIRPSGASCYHCASSTEVLMLIRTTS